MGALCFVNMIMADIQRRRGKKIFPGSAGKDFSFLLSYRDLTRLGLRFWGFEDRGLRNGQGVKFPRSKVALATSFTCPKPSASSSTSFAAPLVIGM